MADNDTTKRLATLEAEISALRERLRALEEPNTRELVKTLREQVAALTSERERLLQTIDRLQAERIRPSPAQLVDSFRKAMDGLRSSLEPKPGERIGYTVSHFDVDLKSFISVDKRDQTVRMVLPEPGEQFPAETLSTIRFVFQTVAKPEPPDQNLVEVPMVLGLSREAAIVALTRATLKPGTISEESSPSPAGTVVRQTPDAGDLVPVEAAVDLVVARKPLVEVPNLLKLKQTDAEARLQESNLNLGAITEEVSKADPGTVIRQSPEAGASVEIGSAVDIVLARAESVSVPNIVGHKEGDALRLLKRARLSAGQKKTRQTSEGIGTILEQDPAPGTEVPPGSAINYVLGVAETSRVPDVVNLSVEKAKELIERARLVTGLVTTRQHPRLDNVVLNQDPDAGKEVPLHTAINLVVAKLWTLKEIGDKIAKHPDFDKIGVPLATLMARIASSQFNSPEKLQQVATFPDIQLVAELGLPNVRSATTLKRIIKSIFL